MSATDVGDVGGVGRKIAAQLSAGGVRTVLDLLRADVATLRRQFSVVFEKTVLELGGTPCMGVEEAPAAKQQILVSRSFGKSVTHIDGIVEAVSELDRVPPDAPAAQAGRARCVAGDGAGQGLVRVGVELGCARRPARWT
jgi:DNA polymerase V